MPPWPCSASTAGPDARGQPAAVEAGRGRRARRAARSLGLGDQAGHRPGRAGRRRGGHALAWTSRPVRPAALCATCWPTPRARPGGGPAAGRAGARRIYSNAGYTVLGELLAERSGLPFAEYLPRRVLDPLGMTGTILDPERDAGGATGRPAGLVGPLVDLVALGSRVGRAHPGQRRRPTGRPRRCSSRGLAGVLPGFQRFDPCDWGLGVEIRGHKQPHWTGHGQLARRPSGTSAAAGPSCGWIRWPGWSAPDSATARSARGRRGPGRRWPTPCWPSWRPGLGPDPVRSGRHDRVPPIPV